ncbi:GDSL-type esterase/lipase family protein [Pseudalkalibacillus caeni]|uniref:GDSL-type esterase/lipase family protein n=1 Tax=Exobacillus caeni TaxID=2574798 RepID=UPI001485A512|nr:GDSL-type esterase/lipase family protein [Pseudalkalibacillus caeni]
MPTLVCFGDNITAGECDWDGGLRLTSRIREEMEDWIVINAGTEAGTTRDGVMRFQSDVMSYKPDLVTIFFGGNDASENAGIELSEYEKNLTYMIRNISPEKVILISPSPIDETMQNYRNNKRMEMYANKVRDLADKTGAHYIDLWSMMKERNTYHSMLKDDGYELNNKGYKLIAHEIIRKIRIQYKKKKSVLRFLSL